VSNCPRCGAQIPPGAAGCSECATAASGPPPGGKTVVVPAYVTGGSPAAAVPAGDDLARVPLPEGWEVGIDIVEGPDAGGGFHLTRSRALIGRGRVEVSLSDPHVSRRHASVEVYGSTCVLVKDLGSTNGTFVNGRRVTACELSDGDEIRVGDTRLVVTIGVPP